MSSWVRVAAVADCDVGTLKGVMVEGTPVVLANVDGDIFALRDECSHEEYPLSDGELDGEDVVTPQAHKLERAGGFEPPNNGFAVQIQNDEIYIDLS